MNVPILPKEAYTSEEWFKKEQEYIFNTHWQFAGLETDLENEGDYLTVQVGQYNIVVVKQPDKSLKAFHNMCRHRGTQLLRTTGKSKKVLTCPYHDWTYSLTGELISVPNQKNEFPDFNPLDHCLHGASVCVWRTMIFVHPDQSPQSLHDYFKNVEPYLGPHKPEKLIEYENTIEEHSIHANWKIVVENYIDGYHLSHLHSKTLNMYKHKEQQTGFVGKHFMFYEPLSDNYMKNLKKMAPYKPIDHIPDEKQGAYVPMLFPNIGLTESESSWGTFHIIPLAVDKTKVVIRTKLMPMTSWEYSKQEYSSYNFYKSETKYSTGDPNDPMESMDVMKEDIFVCEQQQKSFESPLFSVGQTALTLEKSIRDFQTIVKNLIAIN